MRLQLFLFLSHFLLLDFLYLLSSAKSDLFLLIDLLNFLSSDESDSLDDESDNDRSDSGSSDTCSFSLHFYESVSCVNSLGYSFFVPTGFESKCDVFLFVVFVSIGFKSKGGQLIKMIWRSNSWFYSKFQNQFCSYSYGLTLTNSFRPLSLHQKHDPECSNGIYPLAFKS